MTIREKFEKDLKAATSGNYQLGKYGSPEEVALWAARWMADKLIAYVENETTVRNFCEHNDNSEKLGQELRDMVKELT